MGIDPNKPSAARIYDAFLGGKHNFAADRVVAGRAVELVPGLPEIVRANRAFLRRSVRYALARGVDQFLDLGSGIPTEGNVHEVAQEIDPAARIAYVDIDPTAVLYAQDLLAANPHAVVIRADLQEPESVLGGHALRDLLDLSRPIAVLMVAVLHFTPDSPRLAAALRGYRAAVAPGSLLAISHATSSGADPAAVDRVADLYNRTGTPLVLRDRDQVAALFDGWDLVEPGVVYSPQWHPDPADAAVHDPAGFLTLAGVGLARD
ncbi:SAM-dependent methyltransferase [Actinoplanes oblitus]|uniref:SAM-dependent methyltransferase n=1 Tax=Actinoplanes oblitus TaxID=3040509 RepID=A0ABY8WLK0_9ACTN|nr:SAM-dependent methyltransferase [Actinoplanes oblitus]WIM98769.1 SAM-dependent methyltransferase [Actinoplanes oblitus]